MVSPSVCPASSNTMIAFYAFLKVWILSRIDFELYIHYFLIRSKTLACNNQTFVLLCHLPMKYVSVINLN